MKKAVQFGAGNIGRGFIGALLSQSGYHVVFADVVDKIIDKINEDKTYTVHVMDVECEDQKIENISGVNSTKPEAVYLRVKITLNFSYLSIKFLVFESAFSRIMRAREDRHK